MLFCHWKSISPLDGSVYVRFKKLNKRSGSICLSHFSIVYSFFLYFFIIIFYFKILYWFCHTSTCIHHGCTRVPHPEPCSQLPPHTIPLGHPSAPAPTFLYPFSKPPEHNSVQGMAGVTTLFDTWMNTWLCRLIHTWWKLHIHMCVYIYIYIFMLMNPK